LLPLKLRKISQVHQELKTILMADQRFVADNAVAAHHRCNAKQVLQDLVLLANGL
jgi:hypothetical protein